MKIIFASGSFQGQYDLCKISENILEAWPKLGCMKVTGDFAARGGIGMVVVAEYKAPTVFGEAKLET